MRYIYDILLNFNEKLYEFYEWDENDDIEYIKKMPVFKVKRKDLINIKNNDIIIDKNILNMIFEASEIYYDKLVELITYACLFTDGEDVIAIEFSNNGKNYMKSSMLLDEAKEVLTLSEDMDETCFKYRIIKTKKEVFLTRYEKQMCLILNREIEDIYINNKHEKLKYLYYEVFSKANDDASNAYKELKSFINNNWSLKHSYLYNLIRMSYTKK